MVTEGLKFSFDVHGFNTFIFNHKILTFDMVNPN